MTQEEKNTVESNPVTEDAKGLSTRDALDVAIKELNAEVEPAPPAEVPKEGEKEPAADKAPETVVEPPSEWTKEEKEDFHTGSPKQKEAALRLHKNRQAKLEEIRRESADLQWAKDLAKEVEPYIRSVGGKKKAHEAIIDALEMRREFDEGNPRAAAAAYLKAKGVDIPEALLEQDEDSKQTAEKTAMQKRLDALESKIASEEVSKVRNVLSDAWNEFANEKNAAGGLKFPDVDNTSSGIKLASDIGSLVDGVSDLSRQFIAKASERIPNLTIPKLIQEAYRFSGGKVDDSPAPRTQESQKEHLAKSSRAASSVPGRSAQYVNGAVKKYKTTREAAQAALEEIKSREG